MQVKLKSKYDALILITSKKRAFFEEKLSETIDKAKKLWKFLKSLSMPNKTVISVRLEIEIF